MRYLMVLLLAGCVSVEEQNAQYSMALNRQCLNYGFTQGTREFSNCVMQLDIANQQAWNAREIERRRQYNEIVWGR